MPRKTSRGTYNQINQQNKTVGHPAIQNSQKKSNSNNQKVRIIGGCYKRRMLNFISADGLRPTPDRVREMVFSWLMHDLCEATVLDACAGSGVLGFESLSRGASHVTFIEANNQQCQQLELSRQQLNIDNNNITIISGKAEEVIDTLQINNDCVFDVVFLDPPYALNLWLPILTSLIDNQRISQQTRIYIEADTAIEDMLDLFDVINGYEILKSKKIGGVYCLVVCLKLL